MALLCPDPSSRYSGVEDLFLCIPGIWSHVPAQLVSPQHSQGGCNAEYYCVYCKSGYTLGDVCR